MNTANPLNPQRFFWKLSPRLPDNCVLSSDSGSAANRYARDVKIRRGVLASLSGNLATMGPDVPYAIAAKFAYPDRVAIAMVGDGAMQMNGMTMLFDGVPAPVDGALHPNLSRPGLGLEFKHADAQQYAV